MFNDFVCSFTSILGIYLNVVAVNDLNKLLIKIMSINKVII